MQTKDLDSDMKFLLIPSPSAFSFSLFCFFLCRRRLWRSPGRGLLRMGRPGQVHHGGHPDSLLRGRLQLLIEDERRDKKKDEMDSRAIFPNLNSLKSLIIHLLSLKSNPP